MTADPFPVITAARTTTEMIYLTSKMCGILYIPSVVIEEVPVVHGLRTENIRWGSQSPEESTISGDDPKVQIYASNAHWDMPCDRRCPALLRHISDFANQRLFTYNASAECQIVSNMALSAVVWRVQPHCHNKNCLQYRNDEEDIDTW